MNTAMKIVAYIKSLSLVSKIIGAALVVFVVFVVVHLAKPSAATPDVGANLPHVSLASVAGLSDQGGPLPVTGKVTSISKANILAVGSGEIVSLTRTLGDRVAAGSIIASFENSSQRAAVLQAQGAYEGVQAALAKAMGSTAQNSGLNSAQAAQSAQNAATAAQAALRSAYSTLDDVVHTKADALFSNARTDQPQLNLTVSDSKLVNSVQNQRVALDSLVESVRALGADPSAENLDSNITSAIAKAHTVETFLGDLVEALNKVVPSSNPSASTVASYQASIAAGRSAISGAVSGLTSAKSAYDSAVAGAATAANSASSGVSSDIASAEANVKSSLGMLNAAQANLEKTIVRAPISGTIVSLPVHRGDFISPGTMVAVISNPGALEIETYVTSDDAKTLAVGGKAQIDGNIPGVIVFVAPALDPTTGKVQVKVGVPGEQGALTDGDTLAVLLDRSAIGGSKNSKKKDITIPIVAAKITPQGPVVFTVASSTLSAVPVTFGAVVGGQVTIVKGLTLDMTIVTDARGLAEGEEVVVDTQ